MGGCYNPIPTTTLSLILAMTLALSRLRLRLLRPVRCCWHLHECVSAASTGLTETRPHVHGMCWLFTPCSHYRTPNIALMIKFRSCLSWTLIQNSGSIRRHAGTFGCSQQGETSLSLCLVADCPAHRQRLRWGCRGVLVLPSARAAYLS